jgi:hypothetical protein
MALVVKDRVQETSTTTGTGTFTLAGAVSGFQSFSAIGNGNTTYYSITDGTNWEVGIGTYTSSGTTLSRDTVLESSNSDNLVDFGAGSKFVFCTYPADKSVYADASSKVSGYAIENSTIGATTASTGKFTSVTTPSVTATTTDLTLSAISTGVVNVNTLAGKAFSVTDHPFTGGGSNVNFTRAFGGQTGYSTGIMAQGTDGTVVLAQSSKGATSVQFFTSSFGAQQFNISHTASAVNYVQVTGGATTAAPVLSSQGSDSNIALSFVSKGTARHNFFNNGATSSRQFAVGTSGITSAVNFLNVDGSVAGIALPMQAQGTDTNISMAFQPKGTGAIDLAAGSSGVNISNGGTVTAITRTVQGSGYTSVPSLAISAPTTAGGVQATATANLGVLSATIVSGGTGYAVGNTLTVVGGTGTAAQLTVSTVSSGVITAVTIAAQNGVYSVFPTSPVSVTGGAGSGATFNISGGILSTFTITAAGSGYIEQPTVTFSGGGGSGAAAFANVGGTVRVTAISSVMELATSSGVGFRVANSGVTNVNFLSAQGNSTGGTAAIYGIGADTDVSVGMGAKAAGSVRFFTNTSTEQMRVSNTASAVNYVQVTGGATTIDPNITVQGSDANRGLAIGTKGTGVISFYSNGVANRQLRIDGTTAAVNCLNVVGSIAGQAPQLGVNGSDTNIDLALTPKGTGLVRFGTYVAGALLATGYINIKAADGTTYKVLVST